jgi:DNA-binding transcriptional LysR family regulator
VRSPGTVIAVGGHQRIVPLVFGAGGKARHRSRNQCRMGLGLIQVPRYRVSSELASRALVEVLAGFPPSPLPVNVLYSHTRQLLPRLRVFIEWMAEQFRERLSSAE